MPTLARGTGVDSFAHAQGTGLKGNPARREALLAQRHGWAATITGGSTVFVVNSLANSGTGTLRDACSVAGRYIVADPSIYGGTITTASEINGLPNTTIDFLGSGITLSGYGLTFDMANAAGGVTALNTIIQGITFDGIVGSSTTDAIAYRGVLPSDNAGTGGRNPDLTWTRYCTFTDFRDGGLDITRPGLNGGLSRHTIEWCEFGPCPGPAVIAIDPAVVNWNSASESGKSVFLGDSTTSLTYGVRATALGLAGGGRELADRTRVTMHNNWFHGTLQRNPLVRGAHVHFYNNWIENFGWPYENAAPKGKGAEVQVLGSMLAQNNIVDQYTVGAPHEVNGTLVTHPAVDALGYTPTPASAVFVRSGNVLQAGLTQSAELAAASLLTPGYDYALDATVSGTPGHVTNGRLRTKIERGAGA